MLILLGLVIVVGIIFIACESSDGALASDEGATDVAAADDSSTEVVAGEDDSTVFGISSDASCIDCHNDTTVIKSKQVQYDSSVHGSGLTFERNGADCAGCHTSEGFTERIAANTFTASEDIKNPTPVNCRTCHNIHDTYTAADWVVTTNEPVTLELTGDIYDQGNSNLCANCHQPRTSYDVPQEGGGDIEITSPRFGPHHGPQSSMLLGVGGYGEYKGSNVHYDALDEGCISCHMTDTSFGKQAGGHTLNTTYEYHDATEEYLVGCLGCHEDIESFDRNEVQTEVEALLEELHGLLVAEGLIDGESGSGIAGTFTSEQAGALWNYKTIEEDRSKGIHNPGYTKALLQTGIDVLK